MTSVPETGNLLEMNDGKNDVFPFVHCRNPVNLHVMISMYIFVKRQACNPELQINHFSSLHIVFFSVWVCVFVLMASGYGDDRLIQSHTLSLHRMYYIMISIISYKELLNTYNIGIICLSILV